MARKLSFFCQDYSVVCSGIYSPRYSTASSIYLNVIAPLMHNILGNNIYIKTMCSMDD